jgi:hypothetical protein
MKKGAHADSGPYSPKTGHTCPDSNVHYGAGKVGKDYGIRKNDENAKKLGNSSK